MSARTDTKLRETKFFLQNLVRESDKESPSEPEAFLFYLNALETSQNREHRGAPCALRIIFPCFERTLAIDPST